MLEPGLTDDTRLHFSIRDTGGGIPASQIERLFEAFEQIDSSDTRNHGGTGLGLAITRRLAELMGGKVWAESEPGVGSTFHFTATFGRQSSAPSTLRLQGRRIFLVDDHAAARHAISRMLAAHGAEVSSFDSCDAAEGQCALSSSLPFDDLIVDSLMAEGDGGGMITRALSHGVRPDQIVMLLSTAQLQAGSRHIARFGVSRYLVKPVVEDRLIEILHQTAKPVSVAAKEKKSIRSLRVLIAEDNLVNQRVASRFLERDGHTTTIASNGREAIDAFQRHSFDVILMDVQMPVMGGLVATAEIRRLERTLGLHTPIIALTAQSVEGDRERCIAAGMDGYVAKPIKPEELRNALAAVTAMREEAIA